jgi:DNA primase large subunit
MYAHFIYYAVCWLVKLFDKILWNFNIFTFKILRFLVDINLERKRSYVMYKETLRIYLFQSESASREWRNSDVTDVMIMLYEIWEPLLVIFNVPFELYGENINHMYIPYRDSYESLVPS